MRNSNFEIDRQYYNQSASRYSQTTHRKLKSASKPFDLSDVQTKFDKRIEKACTTFSQQNAQKEAFLYKKQIERLSKQNLKKDQTIFEIKSMLTQNKQLQTEMIEVYRVIFLYEGKIAEYQKQLARLESEISGKNTGKGNYKIEELLQSYRIENAELAAQIEKKNRIIFELENKIRKIQNKYFETSWKLSSNNRIINNPLKKKISDLRKTVVSDQIPLLEKQKMFKSQQIKQQSEAKQIGRGYEYGQINKLSSQSPQPKQGVQYNANQKQQNSLFSYERQQNQYKIVREKIAQKYQNQFAKIGSSNNILNEQQNHIRINTFNNSNDLNIQLNSSNNNNKAQYLPIKTQTVEYLHKNESPIKNRNDASGMNSIYLTQAKLNQTSQENSRSLRPTVYGSANFQQQAIHAQRQSKESDSRNSSPARYEIRKISVQNSQGLQQNNNSRAIFRSHTQY